MAQNFWIAIVAWTTCFLVTILVSLATRPHADDQMRGLVWGLTERPDDAARSWHERPAVLAIVVAVLLIALNWYFW